MFIRPLPIRFHSYRRHGACMIYLNGERYFNIVPDGTACRVSCIKRMIQSQGEPENKFHYAENGSTHSFPAGSVYYYQPSLTIGTGENGKRNLALISAQITPDANYYPVVGDVSGTVVGANAAFTPGVDGGWNCAEIRPSINGTAREMERFEMGVGERQDAKMCIDGVNNTIWYDTGSGILNSARVIDYIYCSAWFLCYVNKVQAFPIPDGMFTVIKGQYLDFGGSSTGTELYKCIMPIHIKPIVGTLNEGFYLICAQGTSCTLRPQGHENPSREYGWKNVTVIQAPGFKAWFQTGGLVRILQWGYEYGIGNVQPR